MLWSVQHQTGYSDDSPAALVWLVAGGELFEHIAAKGHYREKDAAHLMRTILQASVHWTSRYMCALCNDTDAAASQAATVPSSQGHPDSTAAYGYHVESVPKKGQLVCTQLISTWQTCYAARQLTAPPCCFTCRWLPIAML